MHLIDTHCHLDVEEFAPDRTAVLAAARAKGVVAQIVPGIHAAGWEALVALCTAEPDLFPALGMHPVYLAQHRQEHLSALAEAIERHRPVAVGEIGLDFYIDEPDREGQIALFEAQLCIARDFDLPVIVHVRKAHDQVLASLRRIRVKGGTAHAFNGSLQQAQHYIDLGFCLGFGGMLTYERSRKIRSLAAQVPIESIVLETDAPDMTTAAHHGERNSPAYLPEVCQTLAEVRDESIALIARQTSCNACALFGLPDRLLHAWEY